MPTTTTPAPETLTQRGAIALVERIEDFWKARGVVMRAWVEQDGDVFVVRSSMVGGRPQ